MKKQYLTGAAVGMLVILALGLLTAMKNNSLTDKDAIEKVSLVRDYIVSEAGNKELKYEGTVSDRREPNYGRRQYVCGDYTIYYDTAAGEVRYVLRGNTGSGESEAHTLQTLREKADGLLAIIKTPELVNKCEVREETDGWGAHFYYEFEEKDIHVSVGCIDYMMNGELLDAAFQTTEIPAGVEINISNEEALRIAKSEAENFMKEKNAGEYVYIPEKEHVTKQLILGEVCIVCEVEYTLKGFYDIPAYFNIRIDPSTGRIIENANSLT